MQLAAAQFLNAVITPQQLEEITKEIQQEIKSNFPSSKDSPKLLEKRPNLKRSAKTKTPEPTIKEKNSSGKEKPMRRL